MRNILKITLAGFVILGLFGGGVSFEARAEDDFVSQAIATKILDMTNTSHARLLAIKKSDEEPAYSDFEVVFPKKAEHIKNIVDQLDKKDAISAAKKELIDIWKNIDLKGFTLVKKAQGMIYYKDGTLRAYGTRSLTENEKMIRAGAIGKPSWVFDGYVTKTFMSLDQYQRGTRTSWGVEVTDYWSVEVTDVVVEPTSRDVLKKIVNDDVVMYRTSGVIYEIDEGSVYFAAAPTLEILDKDGKKFDAKITYKVGYNKVNKGDVKENITVEQKGE